MDITGNPWIINAADVTGLVAVSGSGNNPGDVVFVNGLFQLVIWKYAVHVYQILFEQYIANADKATINRGNGKIFAFLDGSGDFETVRSNNLGWANSGIIIPSGGITNGQVTIYIK